MISVEKQTLRLRMRESLRAMSAAERAEKSTALAAQLAARVDGSGLVFGFAPMRLEPDWTGAMGDSWKVALPRIEGSELRFHRVENLSRLVKGPMGAREPGISEVIPLAEAGAVLVPGLAFDRAGARLGRGGGFYDRLLAGAALSGRRIAICFECQVVERVPVEPHDAEIDAIVTEAGWIDVSNSGRGRG